MGMWLTYQLPSHKRWNVVDHDRLYTIKAREDCLLSSLSGKKEKGEIVE